MGSVEVGARLVLALKWRGRMVHLEERGRRFCCTLGWLAGSTSARERAIFTARNKHLVRLFFYGILRDVERFLHTICSFRVPKSMKLHITTTRAARSDLKKRKALRWSKMHLSALVYFGVFLLLSAPNNNIKKETPGVFSHSQASPAQEGYRSLRDRGSLVEASRLAVPIRWG